MKPKKKKSNRINLNHGEMLKIKAALESPGIFPDEEPLYMKVCTIIERMEACYAAVKAEREEKKLRNQLTEQAA